MEQKALAHYILKYLGETSKELLNLGVDIVVNPHTFLHDNRRRPRYSASQQTYQLYNFKRSRCFRKTLQNQYALTSWGRAGALLYRVRQKQRKKWDGKYRAIGFDIAERRRSDRAALRRQLRMLGCVELHQSFWVTPHDITNELLCLLKLWGVEFEGDVRVFIIQNIYPNKDLQRILRVAKS